MNTIYTLVVISMTGQAVEIPKIGQFACERDRAQVMLTYKNHLSSYCHPPERKRAENRVRESIELLDALGAFGEDV